MNDESAHSNPPSGLSSFIILSNVRTGSYHVASLLDSHPAVSCCGEAFNRRTALWCSRPEGETEREYLNRLLFVPSNGESALGFKWLYVHSEQFPEIFECLNANLDLKVIHLRRRNLLRLQASRIIANRNGKWRIQSERQRDHKTTIRLPVAECDAVFNTYVALDAEYRQRFADHPLIEVFYEDLCCDEESECGRILDFIGVPRQKLTAATVKQNTRRLDETIENYAELKEAFSGTKWAEFFDE